MEGRLQFHIFIRIQLQVAQLAVVRFCYGEVDVVVSERVVGSHNVNVGLTIRITIGNRDGLARLTGNCPNARCVLRSTRKSNIVNETIFLEARYLFPLFSVKDVQVVELCGNYVIQLIQGFDE